MLPRKLRAVAASPRDAKRVYVGAEPAGLFVSEDGGSSWHESTGVRSLAELRQWKFPSHLIEPHIRDVLVCYDDPRYVFAAGQVGGILRSEDGGETWCDVLAGIDPDIHGLLQHPNEPETLYAIAGGGGPVEIVGDFSGYPPPLPMGRPFYRSTDRGKTWDCISREFDRTYAVGMCATSSTAPFTLVAGLARDIPPGWAGRDDGADAVVVVSRDGGASWQQCVAGLPSRYVTMVDAVEVDRSHNDRIFIGTGGTRALPTGKSGETEIRPEVYVSDNAAATWKRMPIAFPGVGDHRAVT